MMETPTPQVHVLRQSGLERKNKIQSRAFKLRVILNAGALCLSSLWSRFAFWRIWI